MRRETQNCFNNGPHDLKYKVTRGNLERNVSLASYSETDTVRNTLRGCIWGNLGSFLTCAASCFIGVVFWLVWTLAIIQRNQIRNKRKTTDSAIRCNEPPSTIVTKLSTTHRPSFEKLRATFTTIKVIRINLKYIISIMNYDEKFES